MPLSALAADDADAIHGNDPVSCRVQSRWLDATLRHNTGEKWRGPRTGPSGRRRDAWMPHLAHPPRRPWPGTAPCAWPDWHATRQRAAYAWPRPGHPSGTWAPQPCFATAARRLLAFTCVAPHAQGIGTVIPASAERASGNPAQNCACRRPRLDSRSTLRLAGMTELAGYTGTAVCLALARGRGNCRTSRSRPDWPATTRNAGSAGRT